MLSGIILLTSILTLRTILFSFDYLITMVNILPMEIISLGGAKEQPYQIITDWLFLGWIGDNSEISIISEPSLYSSWVPVISISITFLFYFLFNLAKICYLKKQFTQMDFLQIFLRFNIIHFSWIIIWSINNLLFLPECDLFILLSNLVFFCLFTFGLMALIFRLLYGRRSVYYRYNLYWLISYYKSKFKFFQLLDLLNRLLISMFIFFYHYHLPWGMFYLLCLQIIFIIVISTLQVFEDKRNTYWLIINLLFSLIPSIFKTISTWPNPNEFILSNNITNTTTTPILDWDITNNINFSLMIIYFIGNLIYSIYYYKKIRNKIHPRKVTSKSLEMVVLN